MKNKKRISLTGLLIIVMGSLVAGAFLLSWLLNATLLEKYYKSQKVIELETAYKTVKTAIEEDILTSEAFDTTFESISNDKNIMALVVNDENIIVRTSAANVAVLERELSEIFYGPHEKDDVIESNSSFVIQHQRDFRSEAEYMILYGKYEDGSVIFLRTPLESIRESAKITNMFFRNISLGILVISLVVVVILSRFISKPIRQMSEVSESMTKLEFETKYKPGKHIPKEIDSLGNSMNILSETLEHTISELKTANIELQHDIDKKNQMDEMRKEFVSNVSHELKTPIALIQGYAEGLEEGISEDPESRSFYCEVIRDEAEKMNNMVRKLLTLNQLEFGNEPLEMSRFNLTELVEGVVNASKLLLEQNAIEMIVKEKNPVYVWADEYKMEEIVTNYVSNAIHYAKGDKKQIIISTEKKGDVVRLSVFNTGDQIPEESIDRIWEKFYKVDKARTREYGGNGIGLSIVKAIVDSMSQKCGVMNHAEGVEFWVEIDGKN